MNTTVNDITEWIQVAAHICGALWMWIYVKYFFTGFLSSFAEEILTKSSSVSCRERENSICSKYYINKTVLYKYMLPPFSFTNFVRLKIFFSTIIYWATNGWLVYFFKKINWNFFLLSYLCSSNLNVPDISFQPLSI